MARTVLRRLSMSSTENIQPETSGYEVKKALTRNKISAMKEHWEHKVDTDPVVRAKDSPTLAQLKSQPRECEPRQGVGTVVFEVQRELAMKHHAAKSRVDGVSGLGGGVSLWPAMDDMRLSRDDTRWLVCVCAVLITATVAVFFSCHGAHISMLKTYSHQLLQFHTMHSLTAVFGQEAFEQQLLTWHQEFSELQNGIHRDFDMTWTKSSVFDISFIILYMAGIIILLYFLARNMFSKQRLTPRVIKAWLSLLCVVTVWTILSVYLLVCAQSVETATQGAVHQLSDELATLVHSSLDLSKYHSILLYWRTKCLPPTTHGVLTIMGLVAVQDVSYYLQYYSLPVLTAICTPIVKIVVSLRTVYSHQ